MYDKNNLKNNTTDELLELFYWIKDRKAYCRACGIRCNDIAMEYSVECELFLRGINVVEVNAIAI